MLTFACISPHPPLILPDVGSAEDRAKVKTTISSLESLAPKLAAAKPEIIIVSSPHPDWGINVPLYFLASGIKNYESRIMNYTLAGSIPIIPNSSLIIQPILTTLDSPRQHFKLGSSLISQISPNIRIAWISSGDMSHRLKEDGPYCFHPSGPKYDKKFIELLKNKNIKGILNLDPELVEEAGECGLRSFCMLLGALEELKIKWQPEILSCEGPFGVGYLVANIQINANPK